MNRSLVPAGARKGVHALAAVLALVSCTPKWGKLASGRNIKAE